MRARDERAGVSSVRRLFNVYGLVLLIVVLALVAFSATYTVRFTEVAVKTTFGNASDGSIKTEPGFYWKWPYPFQQVTTYDKRLRLLQARSETQQTADDFQIIIEAYMTYRVEDPLKFFQSFSGSGERAEDHFRGAEANVLQDLLRSALGQTSNFRMEDLFSEDGAGIGLVQLEERVRNQLTGANGAGKALSDYGLSVASVGIDRVILPEATTESVIERMGAVRDRLAERFESEGRSQARRIEAEAISNADKILAFAQRRADEIKARGEAEAAPFLAQQNVNPELAVFIQNIKLMREAMAQKFTLVLSMSDFGFELFNPDLMAELDGRLPGIGSGDDEQRAGVEAGE